MGDQPCEEDTREAEPAPQECQGREGTGPQGTSPRDGSTRQPTLTARDISSLEYGESQRQPTGDGAIDDVDGIDLTLHATWESTQPAESSSSRARRPVANLSSRLRSTKTVATVRAEEWMKIRFQDLTIDMFGTEDVFIYSTQALEPPPAFASVWHTVSENHRRARLSAEETRLLSRADIVLVFSDTQVEERMQNAFDIASCVTRLGREAPPVILLPHSMSPDLRPEVDDEEAEFQTWSDAVNAGIDDVIIGEPAGMKMAGEVHSKILQQARNAKVLNDQVNERRELLQHVCDLEDVIYDTVWDFLRERLRTNVPVISEDIGPGIPEAIEELLVGQTLGEGSFGVVCRLLHPRNIHVSSGEVLKMMNKKPLTNFHGIASLRRQINVMQLLSSERFGHRNVVQFYDVYHTETHILFRMEDGGPLDLYKRLVLREENAMPLGLNKAITVLMQCVDGLCHMHTSPQIVHRDLKPENLIVKETVNAITVKFADFDTAQVARPGTICRGIIGTFPFMAPEVVLERKYDPYPADVWSIAIVFLEMICCLSILKKALSLPKARRDMSSQDKARFQKLTMEKIHAFFSGSGNVRMLLETHIHPELVEMLDHAALLLEGMLQVQGEDRWPAPEVFEAARSRFFAPGQPTDA